MIFLLIEPVWNRNFLSVPARRRVSQTFNRTSMESKQFSAKAKVHENLAFNRTSMESKLIRDDLLIRYC